MDHRFDALTGLVGAHGDAFELLALAEEVIDQRARFVHLGGDLEGNYAGDKARLGWYRWLANATRFPLRLPRR